MFDNFRSRDRVHVEPVKKDSVSQVLRNTKEMRNQGKTKEADAYFNQKMDQAKQDEHDRRGFRP